MSPGTRTTPAKKKEDSTLPEDIGHFAVFIKPDYVRARLEEDGEHYLVVDVDRNTKLIPADEFSAEYEVVKPSEIVNTTKIPQAVAASEAE